MKGKTNVFGYIFLILFLVSSAGSQASAELKLESVYPTFQKIGEDLDLTLLGTGFDDLTRVSMYPDAGNKKAIISSVATEDRAYDIVMVQNTLYVADYGKGLQLIDITDPTDPQIISSVDTPGKAYRVTVHENIAYVADGYEGLQIIDVSDTENPKITGSADTPGQAFDVTVSGDFVYVADSYEGLQIIDISDSEQAVITGFFKTSGFARSVTVENNIAYVSCGYEGLEIIDVQDPEKPTIISSLNTPGFARNMVINDNKAYLADGRDGGLQILDIADPKNPTIIASVNTPGFARDVTMNDDIIHLTDGYYGLQIIDVKNSNAPKIIGYVNTPGCGYGVVTNKNIAYVADYNSGVQVIDITEPSKSTIIANLDTPGLARGVKIVKDTAYVADRAFLDGAGSGLRIMDISDPETPEIMGSVSISDDVKDIAVNEDKAHVYVAAYNGDLQIVDASDLRYPAIIGSVDIPGEAYGVTFHEDTAYVASGSYGLHIIKISDPQHPEVIGAVDIPGSTSSARGVAVDANRGYAYVAAYTDGLQVIDISDLEHPEIIGSVDTMGASRRLVVEGDIVYMADYNYGLQIIDVSDPKHPEKIGWMDTPAHAYDVAVNENRAYVADGFSGLQIIDIFDPHTPFIIGTVDMPDDAYGVEFSNNLAYVADNNEGLLILPLPIGMSPDKVDSETKMMLTIPTPLISGNYTIKTYNRTENDKIIGGITFSEEDFSFSPIVPGSPLPDDVVRVSKAIIIAGGGPSTNEWTNDLWGATKNCANYAYRALLLQGYLRENICYLSSDTEINVDVDGDQEANDVDDELTKLTFQDAIEKWAKAPESPDDLPASELLLYITDHGGDKKFRLNAKEELEASDLDSWLDDLQTVMPGKLILVYDACQSGTFLEPLKRDLETNQDRIIITSASDEPAFFLPVGGLEGGLSFSFQFWSGIYLGVELADAFRFAKKMMVTGDEKYYQLAMLDVNGNGIGNEDDDFRSARRIWIGRGAKQASDMPLIRNVCEQQTLSECDNAATIWAENVIDMDGVSSIWAVVYPPCYDTGQPDTPVIDLPTVELQDADNDGRYEGTYDNFTTRGTYRINIYAVDTQDVCSLPVQTSVAKTCQKWDINCDCHIDLADAILALRVLAGLDTCSDQGSAIACAVVDEGEKIGLKDVIHILNICVNIPL